MGNPEHPEPTPERGGLTPERRTTRRRRALLGATGAAAVLASGAFLVAQTRDGRQESLPEPPLMAAASETTPAPAISDGSTPARAAVPSTMSTPTRTSSPAASEENEADENHAAKKQSAKEVREEIDKARAKAKADGFPLQRPPEAKGAGRKVDESAVKQWTEPIKNGTVRVTTARQDLTGGSALLLAGDRGKPVGGGVNCTDKVRFTRDAPAAEQPTLLLCWRTSSARSVVTMMATPEGKPSTDANISIINREWAKLH